MLCRAIPYEGNESYIFVSYCHKDKKKIYPILERMVLDGYRMWYDDGNRVGDDWLDNIESHLENCNACVAFISEGSSLSHNCKNEIVYALVCKKKVIPVMIDCAVLPKGLRMQLSSLHYLKSVDFPSDESLLMKVYDTEECKLCKISSGSLKLREVSEDSSVQNHMVTSEQKVENVVLGERKTPPEIQKHKDDFAVIADEQEKKNTNDGQKVRKVKIALGRKRNAKDFSEEAAQDVPEEKSTVQEEPLDDEKTVYENEAEENTVLGEAEMETGDATVRINNLSHALLIHPAGQKTYLLKTPQTKIGRSPFKCDFVVEGNETISKYHADIILYNRKYFLRDAGSANGTFFNGAQLEPDKQAQLGNPAVFRLSDELLVLVSGADMRTLKDKGTVTFLRNEANDEIKLMAYDTLLLNRNSKWPGGTLADHKVHRAAHAKLYQKEDGVYLVDERPDGGNGTHLNGSRLKPGGSCLLSSGDRIRLGDTTLEFVSVKL